MPILYGVWIPGQGWLRAANAPIAFEHEIVAKQTAGIVGGQVRYIDDSLAALEPHLLSLEKQKQKRMDKIAEVFAWLT